MKQRITIKELGKLSDDQKEKLREWWEPQKMDVYINSNYDEWFIVGGSKDGEFYGYGDDVYHGKDGFLPLLSIGQMIAFIQDNKPSLKGISKARFNKWIVNIDTAILGYKDELCDSLWEATTRILK